MYFLHFFFFRKDTWIFFVFILIIYRHKTTSSKSSTAHIAKKNCLQFTRNFFSPSSFKALFFSHIRGKYEKCTFIICMRIAQRRFFICVDLSVVAFFSVACFASRRRSLQNNKKNYTIIFCILIKLWVREERMKFNYFYEFFIPSQIARLFFFEKEK